MVEEDCLTTIMDNDHLTIRHPIFTTNANLITDERKVVGWVEIEETDVRKHNYKHLLDFYFETHSLK